MAPITYNERAERAMAARRTLAASNYLDLTQLQRYWSPERLGISITWAGLTRPTEKIPET